jgi:DNA-3-methyladenine glycosylase II
MAYKEQFTLPIIPPFRLGLTVWALRRRQKNLIDQWDSKQYKRALVIKDSAILMIVEQKNEKEIVITTKSSKKLQTTKPVVTNILQKMLGMNSNLDAFYNIAKKDKHLASLVDTFKGVKPPRFPTLFEALVNSIACQQVTLDVGILLLNRLSYNYGKKISVDNNSYYAFPRPVDLCIVSEDEIKKLGFSYQKTRALLGISQMLVDKRTMLQDLENEPNEKIVGILTQIRGIGRWSAEYALLRGFGRLNIIPGDDVGAQKNLMQLLNLEKRPDYKQIQQLTEKWSPYQGLVYFHLLLGKLKEKNLL